MLVIIGFAVQICCAATGNNNCKRAVVWFTRNTDTENSLLKCSQLPQPQKRNAVMRVLKEANAQNINTFSAHFGGNITVLQNLWLGEGISIFYCDDYTLELIAQLDIVHDVFEDVDAKLIADIADASDVLDIAWGVSAISAPACWDLGYSGQNVVVGVMDTGIRGSHRDLATRLFYNTYEIAGNAFDDDGNGYIDDVNGFDFYYYDADPLDANGHGTHCAGTVCGDGAAGTSTGVAPNAHVLPVQVMSSAGSGNASAFASGAGYAVENGAQVLSISLGWSNPAASTKNFLRNVMRNVLSAGVVAAVSAGNSGDDPIAVPQNINAPGDCPSPWQNTSPTTAVIAVGAVGSDDTYAGFSSFGPTRWMTGEFSDFPYPPGLMKPDVCAPGVSITSCGISSETAYTPMSGTSMAAPHVAGLLALLLSKNMSLSPRELDSLLQTTAVDLGTLGKDTLFGSGRVDAPAAIAAFEPPTVPHVGFWKAVFADTAAGNANMVFDVGETVQLFLALKNFGASATDVVATISAVSPHLLIVEGTRSYGSITHGETKNCATAYVLRAAHDAIEAEICTLAVQMTCAGGAITFDTFTVRISNYSRRCANIGNAAIGFSVTNFGALGFFSPGAAGAGGQGLVFDGYNYLYGGTAMLGFSKTDVQSGENGAESKFLPVSALATVAPGSSADVEVTSDFIDRNLRVKLRQKALCQNAPSDGIVMLRYVLRNISESEIVGAYFGIYLDCDIHNVSTTWYDRVFSSAADKWVFMRDCATPIAHGACVGIAGIRGCERVSAVSNAAYVWASGLGWTDSVKFKFLNGEYNFASGDTGADWSIIAASQEINLLPDETETLVFAIVAAADSAAFVSSVAVAHSLLETALHMPETNSAESDNVFRAYPNPFNASCSFELPHGAVLEIFDLSGTKVFQAFAKRQVITWQPLDASAGIYFARATFSDGTSFEKRIVLIK